MKVQVSEATPIQLNWLVAKCVGLLDAGRVVVDFEYMSGHDPIRLNPRPDVYYSSAYSPTTDWSQGGPIIEREEIDLFTEKGTPESWVASVAQYQNGMRLVGWRLHQYGPTPLIAAMRCYVTSELGDEVDVPDDLVWDELIYEKGEEE